RLEQLARRLERRVQADLVAQLDHLLLGDLKGGPRLVIEVVLERDDGVEAVVAAGEFDDDEDVIVAVALRGGLGGVGEQAGHQPAQGQKRQTGGAATEELAAGQHGDTPNSPLLALRARSLIVNTHDTPVNSGSRRARRASAVRGRWRPRGTGRSCPPRRSSPGTSPTPPASLCPTRRRAADRSARSTPSPDRSRRRVRAPARRGCPPSRCR